MAIGQLFDYRHFGEFDDETHRPLRLAILVPSRPADDIVELLKALQIEVTWQVGSDKFVSEPSWSPVWLHAAETAGASRARADFAR
jgi:hypothetical protein